MRKFLIAFATIALVAVFLFAFAACNEKEGDGSTADVETAWYANTVWLDSPLANFATGGEASTGVLSFDDATHWKVIVGGGAEKLGDNPNWCNGTYYFAGENGEEGVPGVDPLHLLLFDYDAYVADGGDPGTNEKDKYNPANIALVDPETDETVEKNVEVVYHPDENGVYVVKARGINEFAIMGAGQYKDEITMTYYFRPPQDGSLGMEPGATAPLPPAGNVDLGPIIGTVVGVVGGVAIIVVVVILVKRNKKKKAAAAAAENGEGDISPDDGSEA